MVMGQTVHRLLALAGEELDQSVIAARHRYQPVPNSVADEEISACYAAVCDQPLALRLFTAVSTPEQDRRPLPCYRPE